MSAQKVRIITFHANHNYGAMLQAYGLQEYFASLQHDVQIIDYRPKRFTLMNLGLIYWAGFKPFLRGLYRYGHPIRQRRKYSAFQSFMTNSMKLTKRYLNYEELQNEDFSSTNLVCGSDQIWNGEAGFVDAYFLKFGDQSCRRISYAASFGTEQLSDEATDKLPELLKDFSAISVRETSGIEIIGTAFAGEVKAVVDPTLLHDRSGWLEMTEPIPELGEYIFVYCMQPSDLFVEAVKKAQEFLGGAKVIVVGGAYRTLKQYADTTWISAGPSEFVRLLEGSSLVITNSFHGTAFSLNFGKPLVCLKHATRNVRMSDLLDKVGLHDFQLDSENDIGAALERAELASGENVQSSLEQLRLESRRFAEEVIKVEE